jgi:phosphoglycerate kinase
VDDCVGDVVKDAVAAMENGSVTLLENVRFYKVGLQLLNPV